MAYDNAKIELRNFPLDIEYFIEEYDYVYRITVAFPCTDRDNGKPIKLFLYYSYLKELYSKPEAIRLALNESLAHEIDECLYMDGKRIFDPHTI